MNVFRQHSLGGPVVAVLVLALATAALAAEPTRTTYKEEADPICKVNAEASDRILAGVKSKVHAGKLQAAAKQFDRAAAALKKTLQQLRGVPKPPADTARLDKWLDFIEQETEALERVARKLRAGNKLGAQHLAVRLTSIVERANAQILPFEFKYCRVDASRFT